MEMTVSDFDELPSLCVQHTRFSFENFWYSNCKKTEKKKGGRGKEKKYLVKRSATGQIVHFSV